VLAFLRALPALTMPVIILGGILGGVFTPTEASAVAVVYGILISMIYYRSLTPRDLYETFAEASVLSGAVMLVTATAHVLGYTFTYEELADSLLVPIAQAQMAPTTFLVVLSIVLIVAGTFLDGIAMMFIIVPLFLPAVKLLGIDPIHFGMVVVICWGIGQQTPPVGAALFITSVLARVDILSLTATNLPFICVMLVVLVLVILFPETLVLSVPRALGL
jgi:C4-dicarboxylate transporter DctM subunit